MGSDGVLFVICGLSVCPWRCAWFATIGVIVASYVAAEWMSDQLLSQLIGAWPTLTPLRKSR